MTILELYKKHKDGAVSKEKFLYEVRKDAQLPWINNLTSYSDAIQILKNKGIVRESVAPVEEEVEEVQEETSPTVSPSLEDSVRQLSNLQKQLDEAEAAYRESIKELVAQKGTLVDSVFENLRDAKELKFLVDDLLTIVTMPSKRRTISYKDLSDLLAKELGPELKETIDALVEESKRESDVKGQMTVGGKKIYEDEDATDLSSSINRSKDAVKHAIAVLSGDDKEPMYEQEDLSLEIDALNPKIVAKAIQSEIDKLPGKEADRETYYKIQKKVVNKLKKNPRAYDNLFIANSTEIEKADKKLEMQPVKKDNLKDKPNEMLKAKLRESILKMIKEEHEFDYALNKRVKIPGGGEGIIIQVKGGTLTIKKDLDDSEIDLQMNVVRHANSPEVLQGEENHEEPKAEEPEGDALMEKIRKYLQALKEKKKLKTELTVVPTPQTVAQQKKEVDSDNTLPSNKKAMVKAALDKGETVKYGK